MERMKKESKKDEGGRGWRKQEGRDGNQTKRNGLVG